MVVHADAFFRGAENYGKRAVSTAIAYSGRRFPPPPLWDLSNVSTVYLHFVHRSRA